MYHQYAINCVKRVHSFWKSKYYLCLTKCQHACFCIEINSSYSVSHKLMAMHIEGPTKQKFMKCSTGIASKVSVNIILASQKCKLRIVVRGSRPCADLGLAWISALCGSRPMLRSLLHSSESGLVDF